MEKKDLRNWDKVVLYARARAAGSLRRKDPIAFAYWKETERFALRVGGNMRSAKPRWTRAMFERGAHACVVMAKQYSRSGHFMTGALWYSRAKWYVIVARANGWKMDPRKTTVNLGWLNDMVTRMTGVAG